MRVAEVDGEVGVEGQLEVFGEFDALVPGQRQPQCVTAQWLSAAPDCVVQVRINAVGTPWYADDVTALSDVGGFGIRLPKTASDADIDAAVAAFGTQVALHPLIETARGVENISEIARHAATRSLCLGESDLSAELGTSGDIGLAWVRSRLVVAAHAAGLPAPLMSVWPDVADLAGLAESCAVGRALGFRGRAVVHPRQVAVVVEAFRPPAMELDRAADVLAALDQAAADGRGVATLPGGAMVDAAMRAGAERLIALDEQIRRQPPGG